MSRRRISTTVDDDLLDRARRVRDWPNDATMMDAALEALVARHRKIDMPAGRRQGERVELRTSDNIAVQRPGNSSGKAGCHADDCDVNVGYRQSQQRVPDCATDQISAGAVYFGYGRNAAQLAQRD